MATADTNTSTSLSEILGEYRKALFEEGSQSDQNVQNHEMMGTMKTMIELMGRVDVRLSAIEKNTQTLDEVNKKLDKLTTRVAVAEGEVAGVKTLITRLEGDLQGTSNIMDGVQESVTRACSGLLSVKSEVRALTTIRTRC